MLGASLSFVYPGESLQVMAIFHNKPTNPMGFPWVFPASGPTAPSSRSSSFRTCEEPEIFQGFRDKTWIFLWKIQGHQLTSPQNFPDVDLKQTWPPKNWPAHVCPMIGCLVSCLFGTNSYQFQSFQIWFEDV